ncbi:hypothetical protein GGR55DRAFT_676118 [Xylaria sp. FL0064]|nr:hypothetical protein GGR55DRAFT_676118 [Xylaria sp. FL0064]
MSSLTEFHYYPKLPREIQYMIWEMYSESLPTARHQFLCENYENGFEFYSYRLHSQEGKATMQFRDKRDEFSLAHGVLTVPKHITFLDTCTGEIQPSSNSHNSTYIAANYEKDIFSFDIASRRTSCGGAIAKFFGVDSKTILDKDGKPSLLIKAGKEHSVIDEAYQSIFSARRIAFRSRSIRKDGIFETFNEYDLQMLARFKRLKQIIFIVLRLEDIPDSVVHRASAPKSLADINGRYHMIGTLDSAESEQLLKGYHTGVEVAYAQDYAIVSTIPCPLMGPEGEVVPELGARREQSGFSRGELIATVLRHTMMLSQPFM